MKSAVDHLVYATPDLAETVELFGRRLGVRPTPGGRHVGRGTRNELLALGPAAYLEIIGPDVDESEPERPRPFAVDQLAAPSLVAWAAAATDIDERAAQARATGYDPGPVMVMSRDLPDGSTLTWRLTRFPTARGVTVVPFLIDWGNAAHPGTTSPAGCRLVSFRAEHPDPDAVVGQLAAIGVELDVRRAANARLVAVIAGPKGTVELT